MRTTTFAFDILTLCQRDLKCVFNDLKKTLNRFAVFKGFRGARKAEVQMVFHWQVFVPPNLKFMLLFNG